MKSNSILSSLPDLIKEVVKQTLESIMVAEREIHKGKWFLFKKFRNHYWEAKGIKNSSGS